MSTRRAGIDILAPGLLGPWPQAQAEFVSEGLEVPALRTILSRGRREDIPAGDDSLNGAIARVFGCAADQSAAQAALVADAQQLDIKFSQPWLRSDPVHLRADPHGAHLVHGDLLQLTEEEANALVEELIEIPLLSMLLAPHPSRWYVPVDANVATHPPSMVFGPASRNALPTGEDGQAWRAALTEAQMVLHASAVNERRESRGALPINSLWLWGGGSAPFVRSGTFAKVLSDDPIAQGLGRLAGAHIESVPSGFSDTLLADAGSTLVTFEQLHGASQRAEVERWRDGLSSLHHNWLEPALDALKSGEINELRIHSPPQVTVRVTRGSLWQLWRPRLPFRAFVVSY